MSFVEILNNDWNKSRNDDIEVFLAKLDRGQQILFLKTIHNFTFALFLYKRAFFNPLRIKWYSLVNPSHLSLKLRHRQYYATGNTTPPKMCTCVSPRCIRNVACTALYAGGARRRDYDHSALMTPRLRIVGRVVVRRLCSLRLEWSSWVPSKS